MVSEVKVQAQIGCFQMTLDRPCSNLINFTGYIGYFLLPDFNRQLICHYANFIISVCLHMLVNGQLSVQYLKIMGCLQGPEIGPALFLKL